MQCVEDWLEIYQLFRDNTEMMVGRYCSMSAPGPVVSVPGTGVGLKIILHTDGKNVSSGIMGRYMFFPEKSVFGDDGEFAKTLIL